MSSGSSSFNYQKGIPFFAADEVDDSDFLRPAARPGHSSTSTFEERRQQLLQEKAKIEERTIQSSLRSLSLLNESEEIGISTAEELARQREQLQNTEQKLDEINSTLRISQRHIQGIKSVFGSLKNYFSAPPKQLHPVKEQMESNTAIKNLGENCISKSSSSSSLSKSNSAEPRILSMRRHDSYGHERERSTDDILEDNFEAMGASISRLKGLGLSLQTEIEDQNLLVERIIGKTENTDHRIQNQNQQMNKILKK